MAPASIAVVEDQRLFRMLLVKMLHEDKRYTFAGEAEDAEAGWALVSRVRPDVALLDLQMPKGGGIALGRRIRTELPSVRLLALTSLQDSFTLEAVHETGFHGYIEKDQPLEQVQAAIAAVAQGKAYFSEYFQAARKRALADPNDWRKILSDREQEILSLVGQCMTSAQIAERLSLSQRTVETHRYNIMKKLSIEDAPTLIKYALEHGFARPEARS